MNITTETAANFKGQTVLVTLVDGTELIGDLISVNSKGWNFNVDGTVVSRSISRVASVIWTDELDEEDLEYGDEADNDEDFEEGDSTRELEDARELDALVSELDGATTAELADVFGMAAKELRVHLRALGMGVGKGRRYHLTADQIKVVKDAITA